MAAMDTIHRHTCAQLVGLVYFSISNMVNPLMVNLGGRRKGDIPRHIRCQGRWRNR
jgi:hypothetical protein